MVDASLSLFLTQTRDQEVFETSDTEEDTTTNYEVCSWLDVCD